MCDNCLATRGLLGVTDLHELKVPLNQTQIEASKSR